MDTNGGVPVDLEAEAVKERLAETRQQLGDTVEALVYKTDVPARTSDAVADGIAIAKDKISVASETVSNQAVGVAATIYETVETAKASAVDVAAIATSSVPPETGKTAVRIAIGIAIFVAIAVFVRGRRSRSLLDEPPSDESPEVGKPYGVTN